MNMQNRDLKYSKNLLTAFRLAVLFCVATIFLAFGYEISGEPQIYQTASFLSNAGNDIYLAAANALLICWSWRKKRYSIIKLTLGTDLGVWLAVQATKLIPFGAWALRPGGLPGGFPSGHAAHAFAMAILLTTYFPRTWWLWYPLAMAIAWSRIEVWAHTAPQVAAGVFYGVIISRLLINRWLNRQETETTLQNVLVR